MSNQSSKNSDLAKAHRFRIRSAWSVYWHKTTAQRRRYSLFALCLIILAVVGGYLIARPSSSPSLTSTPATTRLISLGGSIAAGAGLDAPVSNSLIDCHQTEAAFPYLMAQQEHLELIQKACANAKLTNGILDSQITHHGTVLPSQLAATKAYMKHSIVTLFAGGNDDGWIKYEKVCFRYGCPQQAAAIFQSGLKPIGRQLKAIVAILRSEGAARVIVNEYYAVTTGDSSCLGRQLTAADVTWLNSRLRELNSTIATSARAAGAVVVDPHFTGHYVCSTDPWVQGPYQRLPMHPTAAGQEYLAKLDESVLKV